MPPEPLPAETIALIDSYYARRWETLLSVDDMVADTINKLQQIGQLNNTYIMYTSDHGYHLGNYLTPLIYPFYEYTCRIDNLHFIT